MLCVGLLLTHLFIHYLIRYYLLDYLSADVKARRHWAGPSSENRTDKKEKKKEKKMQEKSARSFGWDKE